VAYERLNERNAQYWWSYSIPLVCVGSGLTRCPDEIVRNRNKQNERLKVIINKTTSNIFVTVGDQVAAKTFQGFKKLNGESWGLTGVKADDDKIIVAMCAKWSRNKQTLREAGTKAGVAAIRSSKFTDIRVQEKTDAKGKKHVQINLAERVIRLPKAATKAARVTQSLQDKATIASLTAQLAALSKGSESAPANDMAALVTA
jgi:hypothetical protein